MKRMILIACVITIIFRLNAIDAKSADADLDDRLKKLESMLMGDEKEKKESKSILGRLDRLEKNVSGYGNLMISGKSYIEYSQNMEEGKENENEFGVGRFYLNVENKISRKIDFKAATDIQAGAYAGKDNYYMVYIKYLYLTFKDIYPVSFFSNIIDLMLYSF